MFPDADTHALEQFGAEGDDVLAPEGEPGGKGGEEGVFDEFAADEDFAGAAAAIELDGAEGDLLGFVDAEGALKYEQGERDEHGDEQQGGTANGDAKDQQQTAEHFEPREGGSDKVQQEVLIGEVVLPDEFEELNGVQGFAETHVNEQSAEQPAGEQRGDINRLGA